MVIVGYEIPSLMYNMSNGWWVHGYLSRIALLQVFVILYFLIQFNIKQKQM